MDLSVLALRQTIMAVATGKPTACYLPPAPCRLLLPHIINLVRPQFWVQLDLTWSCCPACGSTRGDGEATTVAATCDVMLR
jgi:hypothetical protein